GNHDDRARLRAVFPRGGVAIGEAACFLDHLDGWCLVGLDSQIPGQNTGRIGSAQLDWLARVLADHARTPTVVFVHHAPIPTGHPKMDAMGLLDAEALERALAGAPWVRAVCHGHVHRDLEGHLGAVPVHGAPSTAFQFPARVEQGAHDPRPPGARILWLERDGLRTEVLRLPTLEYVPCSPHD
ncbi:MAG: hypothetical protein KDK70_14865, partial [Myxococcales bacterium]|nr:hypothetical protein [Myxococcales bacterium]